jgi:hypothetical protein
VPIGGQRRRPIDRAILTEAATFKQANPALRAARLRRASASFQLGVAARVADRLDVMHQDREAAVRARRSTETALILARHRVVEGRVPRDRRAAGVDDGRRPTPDRVGVSRRMAGRRPRQPEPSDPWRCLGSDG